MEAPKEEAGTEAGKTSKADKVRLAALGGEKLAGSGFENEEPEPGFTETDTSGPAPDQKPDQDPA